MEPKKIKVIDIIKKEPAKTSFWAAKKDAAKEKEAVIKKEEPAEEKKELRKEERKEEVARKVPVFSPPPATASSPLDEFVSESEKEREKVAEDFLTREFQRPEKKDVFKPAYQKKEEAQKTGWTGRLLSYFLILVVVGLLAGGGYAALAYLPKADIKIAIKKTAWEYKNPVSINTKLAEIDPQKREIPGAVFSKSGNFTLPYPASGKRASDQKASGVITIYNNFSSASQVLVAGTRFQEPGGKIFKLEERVTVPGAKVSGSSVAVPGSIEARVAAEKPGSEYAISPVTRFTIPGFSGTPKFEKFYGQSAAPMAISGGLFPTDDDIKKAREAATEQLKGALRVSLQSQISSQELKAVSNSEKFSAVKETVNKTVDESGNFSIYLEGETSVVSFREAHLLALLAELKKQVNGDMPNIKEYSLQYGNVEVDPKTGLTSLAVNFTGVFWNPLDVDGFKKNVSDKSDVELRDLIKNDYSDRIESANISFWPVWVSRVPENLDRVKVEME